MQMFDFIIEKLYFYSYYNMLLKLRCVLCYIRAKGGDRLKLLRNDRCSQQITIHDFQFCQNARHGLVTFFTLTHKLKNTKRA